MWPKEYRDYEIDTPLIKNQVRPGKGIKGCEMHDLNGWGNSLHIPKRKVKKGFLKTLIDAFFEKFSQKK